MAVAATASLAVIASQDDRNVAFSRGVPFLDPVVEVPPGLEACQGPLSVPESFDQIEVFLDPRGQPLIALDIAIRDAVKGDLLSHGLLFPDLVKPSRQQAELEVPVPSGREVMVCLRNDEAQPVVLYGAEGNYDAEGSLRLGASDVPADLYLGFSLKEPRSALSQLPNMVERASLWRPGWIGEWVYWILLVAVVLGVPLLLATSLRSALRED